MKDWESQTLCWTNVLDHHISINSTYGHLFTALLHSICHLQKTTSVRLLLRTWGMAGQVWLRRRAEDFHLLLYSSLPSASGRWIAPCVRKANNVVLFWLHQRKFFGIPVEEPTCFLMPFPLFSLVEAFRFAGMYIQCIPDKIDAAGFLKLSRDVWCKHSFSIL